MPRSYGSDPITIAKARIALDDMLRNARPERILAMTPESLARINRTPLREIECKLLAAQDRVRRAA